MYSFYFSVTNARVLVISHVINNTLISNSFSKWQVFISLKLLSKFVSIGEDSLEFC